MLLSGALIPRRVDTTNSEYNDSQSEPWSSSKNVESIKDKFGTIFILSVDSG